MPLTPQQRRNIVRARLKMIQAGTANRLDPIEIRPFKPVGAADPSMTPATGAQRFANPPTIPEPKMFRAKLPLHKLP